MLPLDDRSVERFLASLAGRPELVTGTSQILFGGMQRLSEGSVISVKNRSHAVTAEVEVPEGGASGVIIAQGEPSGAGPSTRLHGTPRYCHNLLGLRRFVVAGTESMAPGRHQVRMEFAAAGQGLGIGGTVTLYIDGSAVGSGAVEATVPLLFSGDETTDIGSDLGTPVSDEYPARATNSRHRAVGADRRRPGERRPPGPPRGPAAGDHGPSVGGRRSSSHGRCSDGADHLRPCRVATGNRMATGRRTSIDRN